MRLFCDVLPTSTISVASYFKKLPFLDKLVPKGQVFHIYVKILASEDLQAIPGEEYDGRRVYGGHYLPPMRTLLVFKNSPPFEVPATREERVRPFCLFRMSTWFSRTIQGRSVGDVLAQLEMEGNATGLGFIVNLFTNWMHQTMVEVIKLPSGFVPSVWVAQKEREAERQVDEVLSGN